MSMEMQQPDFSQNKYGIPATGVPQTTPNANGMVRDYSWNNQKKLKDLERQLAEVDARIAEFDRMNPGVASADIGIAAKRAEAGDMSSYNNLVNNAMAREQMGASFKASIVDGIENDLWEARKLLWGLNSKDDEFRNSMSEQIKTALERSQRTAQKYGVDLPDIYFELKEKMESIPKGNGGNVSSREIGNEWWTKARNGTLQDEDIELAEKWVAENPNSSEAEKVRITIEQYRNKTEGAKARAKAKGDARAIEIEEADRLAKKYATFVDEKALADFKVKWNEAKDKEIKTLKKFYDLDFKNGQLKKKAGI